MMKLFPVFILLTVCCTVATVSSRSHRSDGRSSRIYRSVQRLDTVSGTWRTLPACARLTNDPTGTTIVIWNNWGEEEINPLIRIRIGLTPEKNVRNENWEYAGSVSKTVGSVGKACTIESCTIIATTPNPDFTIIGSDFTSRYRIERKTTRKP